jgi:hypothetical protein
MTKLVFVYEWCKSTLFTIYNGRIIVHDGCLSFNFNVEDEVSELKCLFRNLIVDKPLEQEAMQRECMDIECDP